jgi:hypothetical protein
MGLNPSAMATTLRLSLRMCDVSLAALVSAHAGDKRQWRATDTRYDLCMASWDTSFERVASAQGWRRFIPARGTDRAFAAPACAGDLEVTPSDGDDAPNHSGGHDLDPTRNDARVRRDGPIHDLRHVHGRP